MKTSAFVLFGLSAGTFATMIPVKEAPPMVHKTVTAAPQMAHTVVRQMPAAAGATHTVIVGGPSGLVFQPTEVKAAVGDMVNFIFLTKNHTITQSTFDKPCVKKEGGIDSGFISSDKETPDGAPNFMVPVDTTEATWWYCKQKTPKSHCTSGMVFAINATPEKTFQKFLEVAKAGETAAAASTVSPPATPVTLTADNGKAPQKTAPVLAPGAGNNSGITAGWNANGRADACNCACFCGVASFPNGDGVGAFGGWGAAMPAPWK